MADPPSMVPARTGADAVAEALLRQARQPTVFLVTGNQNLPLVDALGRRGVRLVHARHESGAGYQAEGWARLSGEPGIYLVTAGPGLTSALTPLASARLAEVPVILLSASHPRSDDGLGAFQELDQTALTAPLCKAAVRCGSAAELGWRVERAWRRAAAFPPGPVHLEMPADILTQQASCDLSAGSPIDAAQTQRATPDSACPPSQQIADVLLGAERPVVLLRPALGRCGAADRLRKYVPTLVVESPRGLRDPAWTGFPDLIAAADHIALFGPPDYAVDFGIVGSALLHAHPDAGEDVLDELADLLSAQPRPTPPQDRAQADVATEAHGPAHPMTVAAVVDELVGDTDVLVVDGGEFCQWMRYGLRHRPNMQLVNGKLGAIGGSIPMAVGASLHAPERRVVAFIGDGSFGYYAAEIDTAVRHGARMTIVVGVDGCWGSEWHQQHRLYGGRIYATDISERRYDLVASGYGAHARHARDSRQLRDALTWALDTAGVTCVTVRIQRQPSPAM